MLSPSNLLAFLLIPPRAAYVLLTATGGALAFAFVMQLGVGLDPCILCLWQRVPFAVTAVLALTTIVWKPSRRHTRWLLTLCAVALMLNVGLAAFHTGVERHWWTGTSGCAIQPLGQGDIASLREQILNTVVAHCDIISWSLFGLSMANYNVPFSLALAVFAALAARRSTSD